MYLAPYGQTPAAADWLLARGPAGQVIADKQQTGKSFVFNGPLFLLLK